MKILLKILYFILHAFMLSFAFSQEKNTIYVYEDEGVSQESLQQTILTFQSLLKKYAIKTINAQHVKKGVWTQNAILFVMPGGADLPYVKKLHGKGNKVIKQYVEEGGSFLGICAGSYYGSSYVEFDKNGPQEVLGKRDLSFFRGTCVGPILATYDEKTQRGSRAAKIRTILPHLKETIVFYHGGGFFKNAACYPYTTVIGTYDNNLPAIILIRYGQGKVLLSGVHFEYDPFLLDSWDPHIKKIEDLLRKDNTLRKMLFIYCMRLVGVQ